MLQTIKACLEDLLKRGTSESPAEDEAALAEDTFEEDDLDPLDESSPEEFARPPNTSVSLRSLLQTSLTMTQGG